MIINYAASSPYNKTQQYSWRIGRFVNRSVPKDGTDTKIIIEPKYEYRPDLLSYDLYGTPEYYWIFLVRNIDVIRDPIFDLVRDIEIYVPTLQRLKSLGY